MAFNIIINMLRYFASCLVFGVRKTTIMYKQGPKCSHIVICGTSNPPVKDVLFHLIRERVQISASGHTDADQLGTDFFRFR